MNGPSDWLATWAEALPPGGQILDLACGRGRNTLYLLAKGFEVLALDHDAAALAELRREAQVRGLAGRLQVLERDLEDGRPFALEDRRFTAVVVVNYLHRPLFPALLRALAPGGWLIYDTFAREQAAFGRPRNPAFLLEPGELLQVASGALRVRGYEDRVLTRPGGQRQARQRIAAEREETA